MNFVEYKNSILIYTEIDNNSFFIKYNGYNFKIIIFNDYLDNINKLYEFLKDNFKIKKLKTKLVYAKNAFPVFNFKNNDYYIICNNLTDEKFYKIELDNIMFDFNNIIVVPNFDRLFNMKFYFNFIKKCKEFSNKINFNKKIILSYSDIYLYNYINNNINFENLIKKNKFYNRVVFTPIRKNKRLLIYKCGKIKLSLGYNEINVTLFSYYNFLDDDIKLNIFLNLLEFFNKLNDFDLFLTVNEIESL